MNLKVTIIKLKNKYIKQKGKMARDEKEIQRFELYIQLKKDLSITDKQIYVTNEAVGALSNPEAIKPYIQKATQFFEYRGKLQDKEMPRISVVKLINCIFGYYGKKLTAIRRGNAIVNYVVSDVEVAEENRESGKNPEFEAKLANVKQFYEKQLEEMKQFYEERIAEMKQHEKIVNSLVEKIVAK
jgi:hypothetical protein